MAKGTKDVKAVEKTVGEETLGMAVAAMLGERVVVMLGSSHSSHRCRSSPNGSSHSSPNGSSRKVARIRGMVAAMHGMAEKEMRGMAAREMRGMAAREIVGVHLLLLGKIQQQVDGTVGKVVEKMLLEKAQERGNHRRCQETIRKDCMLAICLLIYTKSQYDMCSEPMVL